MLFITAIPDDYYFTWQLEIQLQNFSQLNLKKEDIHVLIGYDIQIGLRHYLPEFIEKLEEKACFFVYPDNRKYKQYSSSIRPHIMQQHILACPYIEQENIFYYDSDIIFRELPDFNKMIEGDSWYVSDTRSYLGINYIKNIGGKDLFEKMCKVVDISPKLIEENDTFCGGAQYLIKKSSFQFWKKVEKDCVTLYRLMQSHNYYYAEKEYIKNGKKRSECHGIQAWCADMWAMLWNAWYFNYDIKIHPELNFCWPINNIQSWYNNKILHYSGSINKEETYIFRKGNYMKYPPYYDASLSKISRETCSQPLIDLIHIYRQRLDEQRIVLQDITFLIPVKIDSESRLENLYYITRYLDKYFNTNIIIAEFDNEQRVDMASLPNCCRYYFLQDDSPFWFHTKINNWLIQKSATPFIALYDADVIIPGKQVLEAIETLRTLNADMVYPYDGSFISVDNLFKEMFGKILDDNLFTLHANKFVTGVKRSFGGAVFIDKDKYIQAGMDNEYFTSWGPEDIERQKRMKNLGYKVKRINGSLFHLPHKRLTNSFYQSTNHRIEYMQEYLKVCRMNKIELSNYVNTWTWVKF